MTALTRRLRSLLIALAVLALSAGAVLAGRSALATPAQPDRAVTHVEGSDTETGETSEPEDTEKAEAPETETGDTDETETDAPAADTSTAVHPDNHGKLVSEAAQAPTPAGVANHGEAVRTVARDNHGHTQAAAATAKHTTKTKTH